MKSNKEHCNRLKYTTVPAFNAINGPGFMFRTLIQICDIGTELVSSFSYQGKLKSPPG